jgi:hypothetical protein
LPTDHEPQRDPSDDRRVNPGDVCAHVMYLDRAGYEQKMTIHFSQGLEAIMDDLEPIKRALVGTVHALGGTVLAMQLEILTTQPVMMTQEGARVVPLVPRPAKCS